MAYTVITDLADKNIENLTGEELLLLVSEPNSNKLNLNDLSLYLLSVVGESYQELKDRLFDEVQELLGSNENTFEAVATEFIPKGSPVTISTNSDPDVVYVSTATDSIVSGICKADCSVDEIGVFLVQGSLEYDTSSWGEGEIIYNNSGLSNTKPSNNVQPLGIVLNSDTVGEFYVNIDNPYPVSSDIVYDNSISGLSSDNVQDALDESSDHGNLSGLLDDDHAQYLALDGRTVPQTIKGEVIIDEKLTFNTEPVLDALVEGDLFWDEHDHTLSIMSDVNDTTLQVGQEILVRVRNVTGSTITNGSPVYVTGAIGNRPSVALAKADNAITAAVFGIATNDIDNNSDGYITTFGKVRNFNTSMWSPGDFLYLSADEAGTFTNIPPTGDNFVIFLGGVVLSNPNEGEIFAVTRTVNTTNHVSINHLRIISEFDSNNNTINNVGTPILDTDATNKLYVDTGITNLTQNIETERNARKDATGFANPINIQVHYDSTTRKVTLSGDVQAFWNGNEVPELVDGWISDAHPDEYGIWYLKYDGNSFQWSSEPWNFYEIQISLINYQEFYKFGTREVHGLMDWKTHFEFHNKIGTYLLSGGNISSYVIDSTIAANRRPSVESALIYDEDLPSLNPATPENGPYTIKNISGANAASNFYPDSDDIIPTSVNTPYFNEFDGSVWKQTLMSNNSYMSVWLVAINAANDVNSQKYRFFWVQGQQESKTLADEQVLTPSDVNLGDFDTPEIVFIGRVIIRFTANNWRISYVEQITGDRYSQTTQPSGNYLSSVNTDNTLFGLGTTGSPLQLNANFIPTTAQIIAVSGDYVLADGTFTVKLTTAANAIVHVKNTGTGTITVEGLSGNIDNSAFHNITNQYDSYTYVCDGTDWWIF